MATKLEDGTPGANLPERQWTAVQASLKEMHAALEGVATDVRGSSEATSVRMDRLEAKVDKLAGALAAAVARPVIKELTGDGRGRSPSLRLRGLISPRTTSRMDQRRMHTRPHQELLVLRRLKGINKRQ